MAERHLYTNRLIHEKSPYLLQHAHNPVDWYPWGQEAFDLAKEQDRPIFLSIGYATCHWCHVMEKETFENLDIAHLMNQGFINIKIDREELPEVDSLYMEFAQSLMSGSAGWPLNLILTPDLMPFFAATYLPPENRQGMMGMKDLLLRITDLWQGEEREQMVLQAEKIVHIFSQNVHVRGGEIPEKAYIQDTVEMLYRIADPVYGGIKGSPKFPIGYQSNFLMECSYTMKEARAMFLVERTIDMMHRGGIYDHLGGGFSRYSVDERWQIPHFEKMLYDNAILAFTYLEAWQAIKRPLYRQVAEEILGYVLRDMTHPQGGFFSAEDADSEGSEGWFYTWTFSEVQKVLGIEESELFIEYYGITQEGNFEGRNVLHITEDLEEFANKCALEPGFLVDLFAEQKQLLWKVREKRVRPFKDDKILSSWNGLMIHALACAGASLDRKDYLDAAFKAAKFIRSQMWDGEKLFRRWRDDEARPPAGLDEYAFLIHGLLSLFETDGGSIWLLFAIELTKLLEEKFQAEEGAFYQADPEQSFLILRNCHYSDGAEPSGNAVHCENLLRLYQMTNDSHYLNQAEMIFKSVKKYLDQYSPGYCYHIKNLNRYYSPKCQNIIIALNQKEEYRDELKKLIFSKFLPHKSVIWRRENDQALFKQLPFLKEQGPIDNKTTLYICKQGVCLKPENELNAIIEAIHKL